MKACVPRFFYLATPPEHYEMILNHLRDSQLSEGCLPASAYAQAIQAGGQGFARYTRILIEKPFGKDINTARHLDQLLAAIFEEKQIYRIDHYLGKETIQNLLALRFANGIFEPTWNRNFIDHVQIALLEEEGVNGRGAFYDGIGALRDVVQNHMLQMVALTAMEQSRGFDASSIRDARTRAIQSIGQIGSKEVASRVVRGQYEGYQKEKDVRGSSATETFVALKLFVETDRWKGVPFYLRTGKKLGKRVTEISIHYKRPIVCTGELCLFKEDTVFRNVLSIRIQPDEGIGLRLMAKKPGFGMDLAPVHMEFDYAKAFPQVGQPEAYERLLLDAIGGDQTLFARTDGIEASWEFVTKILEGWSETETPLYRYKPGMTPEAAEALLRQDGRHWFLRMW